MGAIAPWREVLDQVDEKSQANTSTHTSWLPGCGCHRSHLMLQIPRVSCQEACTLKCWAKINPTFFCFESSLTDLWSQQKENKDKDFLFFFFKFRVSRQVFLSLFHDIITPFPDPAPTMSWPVFQLTSLSGRKVGGWSPATASSYSPAPTSDIRKLLITKEVQRHFWVLAHHLISPAKS